MVLWILDADTHTHTLAQSPATTIYMFLYSDERILYAREHRSEMECCAVANQHRDDNNNNNNNNRREGKKCIKCDKSNI